MTDYTEWVSKLTAVGFDKVSVVNSSFAPVGMTSAADVPSAWNDSEGKLVNENQELADPWETKASFCFFKEKFSVMQKSAEHIVGGKGKSIIVAFQNPSGKEWIIAHGKKKGGGLLKKKKEAKEGKGGQFSGPPDAYNKACGALFDELKEDE